MKDVCDLPWEFLCEGMRAIHIGISTSPGIRESYIGTFGGGGKVDGRSKICSTRGPCPILYLNNLFNVPPVVRGRMFSGHFIVPFTLDLYSLEAL